MKNYTITQEQILELSKESDFAKHFMQIWFPDAFKKELELNKWYKGIFPYTGKAFAFFNSIDKNGNIKGYGIDCLGKWYDDRNSDLHYGKLDCINDWIEATPGEVETVLIAEAKKRGFIEGTKFKDARYGKNVYEVKIDSIFRLYDDTIICIKDSGNGNVFYKGKWAEIIPQEKTVVPMEKALKIIAKKLKTSPENIEIKS